MRTSSDLRALYELGMTWDRAAQYLVRTGSPALVALSAESADVFGSAADSCRMLREAVLTDPDGPLPRAFMAATRKRWAPHQLADLLEQVAATLSGIQGASLQALLLPRPALARLGEFLSDAGQEVLRTVARLPQKRIA